MMLRKSLAAAIALSVLASPTLASVEQIVGGPCTVPDDAGLTDRDVYRIEHLVSSRTGGLAEAMRAESSADRAAVSMLFQNGLYPVAAMPEGQYQCRTIKLGGISELVVYQWFACEVTRARDTLTLSKTTGSQRFEGTLVPAGSGLLYRGALTYGYETTPVAYGDDAKRDQVGCVTKDAEDGTHFVLELPYPVFESRHDVIELVRKD